MSAGQQPDSLTLSIGVTFLSRVCSQTINQSSYIVYKHSVFNMLNAHAQTASKLLNSTKLLPQLQSSFRPGHSTESVVLHVLSDVLLAVDRGDFAALALLDLSAAFDMVDYNILLQRQQTSYGINSSALQWFRSYLVGRTQHVRRGATISSAVHLVCGVPQDL